MPKVSVIIPVYNVEKYLRQCLDSIINQTLSDIEIICIDDGSTDNSLKILEEYAQKDNRIKILRQQNQGAGNARNKGLEIAKGEYLYFLDSDDFLELNAIEKLYSQISSQKADICLFKYKNYDQITNNYSEAIYSLRTEFVSKNIFKSSFTNIWTKLYSKDFIKNNKIEFQNLKTCNDVYFHILSFATAKKVTYLDEYLINYRFNATNNLSSSRGKHSLNIIFAYKKIIKELKKRKLFHRTKKEIYKILISNILYELQNIKEPNIVENLLIEALGLIPINYVLEKMSNHFIYKAYLNNSIIKIKSKNKTYYKFDIANFFKLLFSIKNNNKTNHKVLTVLGIKLKFRRKNA